MAGCSCRADLGTSRCAGSSSPSSCPECFRLTVLVQLVVLSPLSSFFLTGSCDRRQIMSTKALETKKASVVSWSLCMSVLQSLAPSSRHAKPALRATTSPSTCSESVVFHLDPVQPVTVSSHLSSHLDLRNRRQLMPTKAHVTKKSRAGGSRMPQPCLHLRVGLLLLCTLLHRSLTLAPCAPACVLAQLRGLV